MQGGFLHPREVEEGLRRRRFCHSIGCPGREKCEVATDLAEDEHAPKGKKVTNEKEKNEKKDKMRKETKEEKDDTPRKRARVKKTADSKELTDSE